MADGNEELGVQSTVHVLDATMAAGEGGAAEPELAETRYRSKGQLGEGGMGVVEWVWDEDLMRDLAVKRIKPPLEAQPELVQQFLWEARVTASLEHPNVVPVHDLGRTDRGEVFYTMKRVRGMSLAEAILRLREGDEETQRRLSVPRRLRLFVQVVNAVAHAHERGVLHRDLKPDNVMLGDHGEVVVMDWGLARTFARPERGERDPLHGLSRAGERGITGTPLYMAPEQARGEQALDERADIYSLGVMLYELASLEIPYRGSTVSEVLEEVRRGAARPLGELGKDLPHGLVAIVDKAMAADPDDRYRTTAELREEIERLLDGRTPRAENVSLARRVGRFYMHRDRRFGRIRVIEVDAMALGSIVGGVGFGGWVAGGLAPWIYAAMIAGGVLLAVPFLVRWLRG